MQKLDPKTMPLRGTAEEAYSTDATANDPYRYLIGFDNRFNSEALRGVLPCAQNTPQHVKYNLYSEQLNGSAVVSSRKDIRHVWMYRIRPSVAHGNFRPSPEINKYIESCFLSTNPKVESSPSQQAWDPFPLLNAPTAIDDSAPINFVQGIRTIGGKGDASLEEGLAIHIYSANANMDRQAFCNSDGEMLILPQEGRLDVRTELGCIMLSPGEVLLIPSGIRFRVQLPDGPSRGYIHEVFATRHQLPELGVIGANGLALDRHFCHPVASYMVDENPWTITYKLGGVLHTCEQDHSPFDVIGWNGNHVPVKYDLRNFINLVNANKDQADPTLYCVYTVNSPKKDTALSEFLIFTEKWITAEGTFRPPYYHRNMSTEVMGLVFGQYGGSSHVLAPGGLSYEASYMPHGETYEAWKDATTRELEPTQICKDTMAFMFHIGGPFKLTQWALHGDGAKTLHQSSPAQWDSIKPHFFDHAEQIAAAVAAAKLETEERRARQDEFMKSL